jgi:hypothetical protein
MHIVRRYYGGVTISKGIHMNILERFHIHKITKQGIQLNDMYTNVNNLIFDALIKKPVNTTNIDWRSS